MKLHRIGLFGTRFSQCDIFSHPELEPLIKRTAIVEYWICE